MVSAGARQSEATEDLRRRSLLGFALATIGQQAQHRFRSALEPHGLHPRAFGVLLALSATEAQSQQQLSRSLGIPASRIVALLDDLQATGLVVRRPHPSDRRIYAVSLTPEGAQELEAAAATALALEEQLTAGLDPQERAQLAGLLQRVAVNLDDGRGDGPRIW
jgi:DNA-binding MarR family transcriptional regulator